MAHAKLSIICCNCGADDQFEHTVRTELADADLKPYAVVSITCRNCCTIHYLEDYSNLKDANTKL